MHRINTSGSVSGAFNDGNPAIGQQATVVDAAWLNSVQEEIVAVIVGAGLVLGNHDHQLYDALTALIAGVVGTGGGSVPTTRNVLGAGLLAGQGGTLVADRTFTLTPATPAEAAAQVLNTVPLTPASLVGLIGLTGSVLKLGNAILMIASGTANANGTTIISLPDTFPTAAVAGWCNGGRSDTGQQDNGPFVSGVGLSTASVFSAINSGEFVTVFVLGY